MRTRGPRPRPSGSAHPFSDHLRSVRNRPNPNNRHGLVQVHLAPQLRHTCGLAHGWMRNGGRQRRVRRKLVVPDQVSELATEVASPAIRLVVGGNAASVTISGAHGCELEPAGDGHRHHLLVHRLAVTELAGASRSPAVGVVGGRDAAGVVAARAETRPLVPTIDYPGDAGVS